MLGKAPPPQSFQDSNDRPHTGRTFWALVQQTITALVSEPVADITELWLLDRFVDLFRKFNQPFF